MTDPIEDDCEDLRLEELRSRVRRLDEAIVALIAERTYQCLRIGKHKLRNGLLVRSPRVEARVISNAREVAVTCGLEPDVAESILRILIGHSVAAQLEQSAVTGLEQQPSEGKEPDGGLLDW
jgi:chorismate mutase